MHFQKNLSCSSKKCNFDRIATGNPTYNEQQFQSYVIKCNKDDGKICYINDGHLQDQKRNISSTECTPKFLF